MNEHNNQFEWDSERNRYGSALYDLNYIQEHRKRRNHEFWRGVGKVAFWTGVLLAAWVIYPW